MGSTPWVVEFVNVAVPRGEVLVGLGLLVAFLARLAASRGAFMMLTFSLGNRDVAHGYVDGDFAYMLVFLPVAASARAASSDWPPTSFCSTAAANPSSNATPGRGSFSDSEHTVESPGEVVRGWPGSRWP